MKADLLQGSRDTERLANKNSKFAIILGWIAMIATAYKCDHLQTDKVAFDPYEILGIDSVG